MFISNCDDIYLKVTDVTPTHYMCGDVIFSKVDVITDYHPLDDMVGKLHLHVVGYYNY